MPRFVYLVDDDTDYRSSLRSLLATRTSFHLVPFATGDAFLAAQKDQEEGVVLLDNVMPGLSGLDVLAALRDAGIRWPVIMLTGQGDTATAVKAMKLGAIDYLEKPHRAEELFASIDAGFKLIDTSHESARYERLARARVGLLSQREQTVLALVVGGLSSKEIAEKLNISLRTVEVHRAHLMDKMQAHSLAEAVRIAIAAQLAPLYAVTT